MSDRSLSQAQHDARSTSWTRRLALSTLLAALPLLFFGGSVTTLHAGLAIDGWLILEPGRGDWFLWAYPVEQWFRDVGTFVEHTHRLIGSLVGLLAIGTVCASWCERQSVALRALAAGALLAVIGQGVLGGLRVLERSDDLAFLHGAFGQLVFALLGATAFVGSNTWRTARATAFASSTRVARLAAASAACVYAQIVVGAWLRHGGSTPALVLHGALVPAVATLTLALARALKASGDATCSKLRRNLLVLLGVQIALGVCALLSVYVFVGPQPTQVRQALFPTLHVIGGALLLLEHLRSVLWTRRMSSAFELRRALDAARASDAQANLGGAR